VSIRAHSRLELLLFDLVRTIIHTVLLIGEVLAPAPKARFYDERPEICANLSVPFPKGSGKGDQEKSLARKRKANIVPAPPRLAEEKVVLPERLF
jgi:hypothetical protein